MARALITMVVIGDDNTELTSSTKTFEATGHEDHGHLLEETSTAWLAAAAAFEDCSDNGVTFQEV